MTWLTPSRRSHGRQGGGTPAFGQGLCGSSRLRVVLALVCIVLVLMAGSTQVLHQHTLGEAQNPNCSLCVVAHLSTVVTPVTVALVEMEQVSLIRAAVPRAAAAKAVPFHRYVRPPPAGLA